MTSLEITTAAHEQGMLVRCIGRLDANHTAYLNDVIDQLVREGHYQIQLDFSALEYLSSAGIRLLISQYKTLQTVNGRFSLCAVSEPVTQILTMVGMADILIQCEETPVEATVPEDRSSSLSLEGYRFSVSPLEGKGVDVVCFGRPEVMVAREANDAVSGSEAAVGGSEGAVGGFGPTDARVLAAGEQHYALGLGAIGDQFEACKDRFGEFLMVDGQVAYLPADGSKRPDYMVNSGQLIASLTALYGLSCTGDFPALVHFSAEKGVGAAGSDGAAGSGGAAGKTVPGAASLGVGPMLEGIYQLLGYETFLLISIAEISGLVGVSLNQSPVGHPDLFAYPGVKETVNVTTEPECGGMLGVTVGLCSRKPDEGLSHFLRPVSPGAAVEAHLHTAVFPYTPLKKAGLDLHETLHTLFEAGTLSNLFHLVNDARDIVGLGESQFVQGFCWVAPLKSLRID